MLLSFYTMYFRKIQKHALVVFIQDEFHNII